MNEGKKAEILPFHADDPSSGESLKSSENMSVDRLDTDPLKTLLKICPTIKITALISNVSTSPPSSINSESSDQNMWVYLGGSGFKPTNPSEFIPVIKA